MSQASQWWVLWSLMATMYVVFVCITLAIYTKLRQVDAEIRTLKENVRYLSVVVRKLSEGEIHHLE